METKVKECKHEYEPDGFTTINRINLYYKCKNCKSIALHSLDRNVLDNVTMDEI